MLILRDAVDVKTRLLVYYGVFFSLLQYGIILWGNSSNSKTIFKLQKRYLRTIFYVNSRHSCKFIFLEHNILTLPCLYIYSCLVFIHSNQDLFQNEQHLHVYSTRFRTNLQYPIHRLKLYEQTPQYMGFRLYNKLPNCFKSLSIANFKLKLRLFLIEKCYYKVVDFLNESF